MTGLECETPATDVSGDARGVRWWIVSEARLTRVVPRAHRTNGLTAPSLVWIIGPKPRASAPIARLCSDEPTLE
jgi:hypothetical protein